MTGIELFENNKFFIVSFKGAKAICVGRPKRRQVTLILRNRSKVTVRAKQIKVLRELNDQEKQFLIKQYGFAGTETFPLSPLSQMHKNGITIIRPKRGKLKKAKLHHRAIIYQPKIA